MANFLSSIFSPSTPQSYNFERLNPSQQQLRENLIQFLPQLLGQIQQNQPNFNAISNQARNQFQSQTLPSIAERFTSMGSGLRSSDLQGTLGAAGAGLESQLAGQQAQFGLAQQGQQQNLLENLLSNALRPTSDVISEPGSTSYASQGLGIVGELLKFIPLLNNLLG